MVCFNSLVCESLQQKWASWIENPEFKIENSDESLFFINERNSGVGCVACKEYSKFTSASKDKANCKLARATPKSPGRLRMHKDSSNEDHQQAYEKYITKRHSSVSASNDISTQTDKCDLHQEVEREPVSSPLQVSVSTRTS
jgi:hypothetical protein